MTESAIRRMVFFCLVILSTWGCAGIMQNYGTILPDQKVTHAFENFQVNPGYNYYITGSYLYPHAILALDKKYTLAGDLWTKVEMTSDKMKEMVSFMRTRAFQVAFRHVYGFAVSDEKGRKIGLWYSILSVSTAVRVEGTVVTVHPPPLDTYERYERDWISDLSKRQDSR